MTMAGTGWRRSAVTAVVALVTVAACGTAGAGDKAGGQSGEPVVLTMLDPFNDMEVEAFVQEVERVSGGALRIETRTRWHDDDVGKERDVIEAIRDGSADLGITGVRAWHEAGVRSFDALIAPLTVDSPELQQAVLESDIGSEMLAGPGALGLVGVAVLPGPVRLPVGISRDLLGAETYAGAHLATSPGAVAVRSLEALGATTTATVYDGADVSTFDGMELQAAGVGGNRYDEVARSITANVALWPRPMVVFGDVDAFADLTDAQREILRTAGQNAVRVKNDFDRSQLQEELGNMCRRGHITFTQATPEQIAGLRERLQPVYAWLEDDAQTRDLLGRIRALAERTAAVQPALACPTSTEEPHGPTTTSPIDGVWESRFTREEFAAAGADSGELEHPENWGGFRIEFRDGRVWITGSGAGTQCASSTPSACSPAAGSFTLDGDGLTIDFDNGEEFTVTWSLYRDQLTFARDGVGWEWTGLVAKPWTRVG
jgi:TRAP-type C4-dicarboxylate transport system substrate-binding protein